MITESTLQTKDGLSLFTKSWMIDNAKANIFFVHGFFEHCSRYDDEAKFFNQNGYNFFAYDQRTHGKSDGEIRSYIKSFDNYLNDYQIFLNTVNDFPSQNNFLFSHSMGGLVQLSYLLDNKYPIPNFRGTLFSAPLIMAAKDMAPLLQKLSGIVGTFFPKLKTVKADATAISRDPQEIEKYKNDPLIYTEGIYAASGKNILKQIKKIEKRFVEFDQSVIIQHGTNDKLAELEGSKNFITKCSSKDATFIQLQEYKHEITKDLNKENVLSAFVDWMNERIH